MAEDSQQIIGFKISGGQTVDGGSGRVKSMEEAKLMLHEWELGGGQNREGNFCKTELGTLGNS